MARTDKQRVYLDYNATAPCRPGVTARVAEVLAGASANPSSLHTEGRAARAIVEEAREQIADAIGARPLEIVFTSGGTEADNLALEGSVRAAGSGHHMVTTAIEHPAVLDTCRQLEERGAASLTVVPCDRNGQVAAASVAAALQSDTCVVSIMHANNEVGSIQPIPDIAGALSGHPACLHCDAVQSLGRLRVKVSELGVDLLSASGHKLGGPKGTGFLYVREGTPLSRLMVGGSQERERRGGTENVAGIAGLAMAVNLVTVEQEKEATRLDALRRALWDGLGRTVPGAHINGDIEQVLPNTLSMSVENISGEDLMMALDLDGLSVSTGSACAVGAGKPSHVMEAMELTGPLGCGPIRFSLGYATTEDEIDRAVGLVSAVVTRLRESGTLCCCARAGS